MPAVNLYVVADCSGSMAEPGKAGLLRYLLSYLLECGQLAELPAWCRGLRLIAWSDRAQCMDTPAAGGVLPLTLAGRADVYALMHLLEQEPLPWRLLLLSDGNLSGDALAAWQARRTRLPQEVRAVAVGADASLPTLEAMTSKGAVFLAEDIGAALHDWQLQLAEPRTLAALGVAPATDDWA